MICPPRGTVLHVALRKESVDRNVDPDSDTLTDDVVALRKESVDRNVMSTFDVLAVSVALRKESVDRNDVSLNYKEVLYSRSPQGERG